MRIAIVAPPWVPVPPPAYGGTEVMLDTLARGLVAAGHEVLLYATGDSTCPVRRGWVYETARGLDAVTPAYELRHVIGAYEAVAEFDIVHDHTLIGPVYADRFPWLPVVTTNHLLFDSEVGVLYRTISDRVPVIAISHQQAARAKGVNLAGVVHHGVDTGRFPLGSGAGGYAVFMGRMSPDKGVHTAIRAARAAGVPLRIAARMSEPGELRYFADQVEPLLGGDIEFVGEVGGSDKLRLLGEACCLLNPVAWREPFGMVMIEAMATGTPVIAPPVGAAPEIVEDGVTGYLPADHQGLVEALCKVGELDRRACRKLVEERFSAERMVAQHLAIYRTVSLSRNEALFGNARSGFSSRRLPRASRLEGPEVRPASEHIHPPESAGTSPS